MCLYLGELQYFACWAILVGESEIMLTYSHPGDKTCSFKLDHHPKFNDTSVCTFQWLPSGIVNSFEGPTQASIIWESSHPINTHSPTTTTPLAPSREHLHMLPRRNHNGLCQASTSKNVRVVNDGEDWWLDYTHIWCMALQNSSM